MDFLKQIKYNRLISELNKELSALFCKHYVVEDTTCYYYNGEKNMILIYHYEYKMYVSRSFIKSNMDADIILQYVANFTGHNNYLIEWKI